MFTPHDEKFLGLCNSDTVQTVDSGNEELHSSDSNARADGRLPFYYSNYRRPNPKG